MSVDIKNTGSAAGGKDIRQIAAFPLDKELMVKKETDALAAKQTANEIKPSR